MNTALNSIQLSPTQSKQNYKQSNDEKQQLGFSSNISLTSDFKSRITPKDAEVIKNIQEKAVTDGFNFNIDYYCEGVGLRSGGKGSPVSYLGETRTKVSDSTTGKTISDKPFGLRFFGGWGRAIKKHYEDVYNAAKDAQKVNEILSTEIPDNSSI